MARVLRAFSAEIVMLVLLLVLGGTYLLTDPEGRSSSDRRFAFLVATVVVAALLVVWLSFVFRRYSRSLAVEVASEAFRTADRQSAFGEGLLLCDFVDRRRLSALADQKLIDPQPNRVERGGSRLKSIGLGGKAGPLEARGGIEAGEEERAFYELTPVDETLLAKVLTALDRGEELDTDLGAPLFAGYYAGFYAPSGRVIVDTSVLATLINSPEFEQARESPEAMETLLSQLSQAAERRSLVEFKRGQFSSASKSGALLLIESDWEISMHDTGGITLSLAEFRSLGQEAGAAVPAEIGIDVAVPEKDGIIGERLHRLTRITACVFGLPAGFEEESGRLLISPIAVFRRIAPKSSRNPDFE